MTDIAEALGVKKAPDYPSKSCVIAVASVIAVVANSFLFHSNRFDIIWTLQDQSITDMSSEDCPGLDE